MVHLLPRINLHQHITVTQCSESSLLVFDLFLKDILSGMYRTRLRWENQLRSLYNSSWRRCWGPKLKHTAVEKNRVWSYTGRIKRNGKGEFHLKKKGDCRVMSSRLNVELEVFWFVYLFNKDLTTSFVPHIITETHLCIPKFLCIPIFLKQSPYPHGSTEDRQTYNLTLVSVISKSGEERERSLCQGNIKNMKKWGSEPSEYLGE